MLALSGNLTAQVDVNDAVVSRAQTSGMIGSGGLWILDLDGGLPPVQVGNVGSELSGSTAGAQTDGAASVLIDRRTGNLIVGEHAPSGQSTDIHVLTMSGPSVVVDEKYPVATAPGGGCWIDQMGWLGEDIVFSVRGNNVASGPFANQSLGILRPRLGPPGTPGTVVPVPTTGLPAQNGTINAMAVDERRGIAYLGLMLGQIYAVPVPGDGVTPVPATLVTSIPAAIFNMTFDGDGSLLVGCLKGQGPSALLRVDVEALSPTVTPVAFNATFVNALAIENATGDYLLASSNGLQRLDRFGVVSALDPAPGTGLAIRQRMALYGEASPGQSHYQWRLAPNAAGPPEVGNAAFAMRVTATPGVAIGAVGLSLGEVQLSALGISLLLDPTTLLVPYVLWPASQWSVALPIPGDPSLAGTTVFAQAVFVEPGGYAATRGLQVTVTP